MVTQLGMSEKLGPIQYGQREEMMFLGRSISEHRNYSDRIAQDIDEEVKGIVDQAHAACRTILTEHWDELELLAVALLEHETLDAEQFEAIMRGEDPFEGSDLPTASEPPTQQSLDPQPKLDETSEDNKPGLSGTLPAPA